MQYGVIATAERLTGQRVHKKMIGKESVEAAFIWFPISFVALCEQIYRLHLAATLFQHFTRSSEILILVDSSTWSQVLQALLGLFLPVHILAGGGDDDKTSGYYKVFLTTSKLEVLLLLFSIFFASDIFAINFYSVA